MLLTFLSWNSLKFNCIFILNEIDQCHINSHLPEVMFQSLTKHLYLKTVILLQYGAQLMIKHD